MRKTRAEIQAEQAAASGQPATPAADPKQQVPDSAMLPVERDLSAMCIAIKKRGYHAKLNEHVASWTPQQRHVVAMWLEHLLEPDDVPAIVAALPKVDVSSALSDRAAEQPPTPPPAPPPAAPPPQRRTRAEQQQAASFASGNVATDQGEGARKTVSAPPASAVEESLVAATRSSITMPRSETRSIEIPGEVLVTEGETVTATWGEEKYTPVPGSFSTFSVGPFSMTTSVRSGETAEQAMTRAFAVLEKLAEAQRERKGRSFVQQLRGYMAEAKGQVRS